MVETRRSSASSKRALSSPSPASPPASKRPKVRFFPYPPSPRSILGFWTGFICLMWGSGSISGWGLPGFLRRNRRPRRPRGSGPTTRRNRRRRPMDGISAPICPPLTHRWRPPVLRRRRRRARNLGMPPPTYRLKVRSSSFFCYRFGLFCFLRFFFV